MPAADEDEVTSPEPIATGTAGVSPSASKMGDKQYEFKPGENKIIGQLAFKMHFVGLFLLAMGLIIIAIGVAVVFHVGPIISGTLACVVGLWTQRASMSFKNVVQTEGRDITHLMDALDDLRKLYTLQYWLLILGLLLALAGLLAVYLGYVEIVG
jgi:hypothetical protein